MLLIAILVLPQLARIEYPHFSAPAYLLAGLLIYSSLRLTWIAFRGLPHPVSITFWLFVFIWCALAPLLQTLANRFPRPYVHDADAALTGTLILWCGVLFYELGRFLLPYLSRARANTRPLEFSIRTTLILSFVAIATSTVLIIVLGGPDVLMGSRGDINRFLFTRYEKSQALLLQSLLRGPPIIALMALAYILIRHWRRVSLAYRRWLMLALVLLLPVNLIANYPPALQRFWLGAIVLTYLFILLRWTRIKPALYIGLLSTGLILAFPALDAFRKAGATDNFLDNLSHEWSNSRDALYRGDYDAYQQLLNSVVYVRQKGIMYGKNVFDSIFFWYPRRWYPTKHVGSGHHVARHFGLRFTNVAAPLWMEAYLAFSLMGVVCIFFLYGLFTGYLDRAFEQHVKHPDVLSAPLWIVGFWAGYQIYLLRGDLLSGIAYLSCPMLVLLLLVNWRRPTGKRATEQSSYQSALGLGRSG
ncbi:MAG TPA: O-antigen polymerase [Nevskiales bacterium]|nr:O-antigen polymerase [Nevskiales bacterium]